ncbi:hypothetical protein CB1_000437011 [Camelus ferus]|nr:hypothetical protein CB1_000437011 [Camelus ferus]
MREGRTSAGRALMEGGDWQGELGSAGAADTRPLVYPSDSRLTDKEVGPALWERTSPGEQALTRFPVFQKSSICYLSFPDSHSEGPPGAGAQLLLLTGLRCPGSLVSIPGRLSRPTLSSRAPRWRLCTLQVPFHALNVNPQREPAHYFGYVYFRQVKDSSVKRGYFQKLCVWAQGIPSLVLVSRLPFVRLFQALLSLIAPEYFDKLVPCLEAVCSEIDQWPDPMPGQTLNLPVMGVVLQVHIPSRADKPESSPPKQCGHEGWELTTISCPGPPAETRGPCCHCGAGRHNLLPAPVVLSSVHELDLFRSQLLASSVGENHAEEPGVPGSAPRGSGHPGLQVSLQGLCLWRPFCSALGPAGAGAASLRHGGHRARQHRCFQPVLAHVQMLWELMLLGEPLVVLAPSPAVSSEMVLALTSCLQPLKFCCDYRPYFTVHDRDLPKQVKLKKPSRLKTLDTKPGLYTAYTAHLHRDKALLRRLLKQNIEIWMKDKSEVEVVDLVLKLRERLVRAQGHQLPVKEATLKRARLYIETVVRSLPTDLQVVLCSP